MTSRFGLSFEIISVGADKDHFVDGFTAERGRVYFRNTLSEKLPPDRLARLLVNASSITGALPSGISEIQIMKAARKACRAALLAGKFDNIQDPGNVVACLSWIPTIFFEKISQGREYKVRYGSKKVGTLIKEPEGWWFQLWDPIPGLPIKTMYTSLVDARDGVMSMFEGRKVAT